jgi:hypothetical protein
MPLRVGPKRARDDSTAPKLHIGAMKTCSVTTPIESVLRAWIEWDDLVLSSKPAA